MPTNGFYNLFNLEPLTNIESLTSYDFTLTYKPQKTNYPEVDRIIFHNPATIVFWKDGTKTVVKCMKDEPYSEYYGFLCALGKKIYGTNAKLTRMIKQFSEEDKDA